MLRQITFKGSPLTLVGRQIKAGVQAPDFRVTRQDLKEAHLADFAGKIKVITTFPSIDTPVCDLQVKEFNRQAAHLSAEMAIIGVSKDLPFAQKRFCSDNNITAVTVVSDYKTGSFGINYGVLIKELNLLARSVMVVDNNDTVRYVQLVKELTAQPDYADALKNLESVIQSGAVVIKDELPGRCRPCEGGAAALPKEKVEKLLAKYRGWDLVEDKKLVKEFKFNDFAEAKYFLDILSVIAEEQGHHPVFTLIYNKLKVTLTTHAAGGLTENDFIMARIIDEVNA